VTRDFTFEIYDRLLEAGLGADYEHITVREYLSRNSLPEQFVIHRHDVDRKPENALQMARLEADHGISATYYFRTIDKTFQSDLIRNIERLGHEIGYHYEDLDWADGDVEEAHNSFETHLGRLREHAPVDTVCMHGNPLTSYDNRNMWNETRSVEEYGLLGEAYLSMDFVDVTYFSDTGRTWKDGRLKIKDNTIGDATKAVSADTTQDLISLLQRQAIPRVCLLSHPNRWADNSLEYIAEYMKDKAVNAVKHGLNLVT
jgi:hypothetical protein